MNQSTSYLYLYIMSASYLYLARAFTSFYTPLENCKLQNENKLQIFLFERKYLASTYGFAVRHTSSARRTALHCAKLGSRKY